MSNIKGNKRIRNAVLKAIKAGADKEVVAKEWCVSTKTITRWLANESNVQSDISNVQSDISNVQSDISNVQSDISNVQSDISNVPNDKRPSSAFNTSEKICSEIVGAFPPNKKELTEARLRLLSSAGHMFEITDSAVEYNAAFEKAKKKLGYPIKCKDGTELYF